MKLALKTNYLLPKNRDRNNLELAQSKHRSFLKWNQWKPRSTSQVPLVKSVLLRTARPKMHVEEKASVWREESLEEGSAEPQTPALPPMTPQYQSWAETSRA